MVIKNLYFKKDKPNELAGFKIDFESYDEAKSYLYHSQIFADIDDKESKNV